MQVGVCLLFCSPSMSASFIAAAARRAADADQSGALDVEEIEKFLQSLGHTGDTEATAKMVVEQLDQPDADGNPGNGEIEKEEFVEWMVASEAAAKQETVLERVWNGAT